MEVYSLWSCVAQEEEEEEEDLNRIKALVPTGAL